MDIVSFSVNKPVTITMLMIAILFSGLAALFSLNVDLFPDIDFPMAFIQAPYPGVNPAEMENIVTKKIEEEINTVENIKKITSYSFEGYSQILVEFNWGTNIDFGAIDLREKVDIAKRKLPRDIEQITVSKFDVNARPIIDISVGGKFNLKILRTIVEKEIKPAFERISGVANVELFGGLEREIKVKVSPVRLKAYSLTINDIVNAIRFDNRNTPVGNVEERNFKFLIKSEGEVKSPEDLENIIIKQINGKPIYISDVAKVYDSYKDIESISRLNFQSAITLSIKKEAGANPVNISDKVKKTVASLEKQYKGLISITIANDRTNFIRNSIQMVKNNATSGALLAIIIVFLYLKNFRTTLIIGLGIPLAVLAAFGLIFLKKMTLNLMTLGGLALGIGMMVDNSIVVLENIYRHFTTKGKKKKKESAISGAKEVMLAILASTLTTLAVFVPLGFVPGIVGEIFINMSLAIVFSLSASYVIAIVFVPMMCSKILKVSKTPKEPVMKLIKQLYKFALKIILSHWFTRLVYCALIIALFFISLKYMPPMSFFPSMDRGIFYIKFELPEGTSISSTDKITKKIENICSKFKEITKIISKTKIGEGIVTCLLIDKKKRKLSTKQIIEPVRKEIQKIPGIINITYGEPKLGPPHPGKAIQIEVSGNEYPVLEKICKQIAQKIKNIKGIKDLDDGVKKGRPELKIKFDREKIRDKGLDLAYISNVVRTCVYGTISGTYKEKNEDYDIRVELMDEYKDEINKIKTIEIPVKKGKIINLSEIAKVYETRERTKIERKNLKRVLKVEAENVGRPLQAVVQDIEKAITPIRKTLPPSYEIGFGGEEEERRKAFKNLFIALIAAIILVYMVMASQFESFIYPFVIMFTIPLSIIGVVFALKLSGFSFSITAMIGIIMLAGIVVNNGIILIDYILKRRIEFKEDNITSCINAGIIRIRPVLMTTSTTIAGMIPLALGVGAGSDFYQPLAITVIGGLTISTFLTLTFIPALFLIFDSIFGKLSKAGKTN